MIKYRTSHMVKPAIKPIKVAKASDEHVWVKRPGGSLRRQDKRSEYTSYFDTYREALCHLRAVSKLKADAAKYEAKRADAFRVDVMGLMEG
jgi:hypothetical protein